MCRRERTEGKSAAAGTRIHRQAGAVSCCHHQSRGEAVHAEGVVGGWRAAFIILDLRCYYSARRHTSITIPRR